MTHDLVRFEPHFRVSLNGEAFRFGLPAIVGQEPKPKADPLTAVTAAHTRALRAALRAILKPMPRAERLNVLRDLSCALDMPVGVLQSRLIALAPENRRAQLRNDLLR